MYDGLPSTTGIRLDTGTGIECILGRTYNEQSDNGGGGVCTPDHAWWRSRTWPLSYGRATS